MKAHADDRGPQLNRGPLWGRAAICFGDSITWYDGNVYTWGKEAGKPAVGFESYLRRIGMRVQNEGLSNATIREIREKIFSTDLSGYDDILVTSGANDSRFGLPTGVLQERNSSFDNTTFFGCLQEIVEHIQAENPSARIILMTPVKGWIYAPEGYACERSRDGEVEERFAEAIKAVAGLYGCLLCNWYGGSGLERETMSEYYNDPEPDRTALVNPNPLYTLHPSAAGYRRMAELLLSCLLNSVKAGEER